MYKLIILDADGTLFYTPLYYVKNVLEESLGFKVSDNDAKIFWFEEEREEFIEESFGVDRYVFWNKFKQIDTAENRRKVVRCYDDVYFLEFLKERYGLKYGILSNAHQDITKMELELLKDGLIDIVYTCNPFNGTKPKPDPEGALYILDSLGIKKEDSMLVGDGKADILCGRNAGILDVLFYRFEHKVKLKPTHRITRTNDLISVLENDY